MAAVANNFTMYKGEDVTVNFTVYGASSTVTPLDVTGYTTLFSWKLNPEDPTAIFTATGVLMCSTGGKIAVTIASCQTIGLTSQLNYAHDLWRLDVGSFACLSIGTVTLSMSVNKP